MLQVNCAYDIGCPAYGQLQKLRQVFFFINMKYNFFPYSVLNQYGTVIYVFFLANKCMEIIGSFLLLMLYQYGTSTRTIYSTVVNPVRVGHGTEVFFFFDLV
jgi:hypothetical protein